MFRLFCLHYNLQKTHHIFFIATSWFQAKTSIQLLYKEYKKMKNQRQKNQCVAKQLSV